MAEIHSLRAARAANTRPAEPHRVSRSRQVRAGLATLAQWALPALVVIGGLILVKPPSELFSQIFPEATPVAAPALIDATHGALKPTLLLLRKDGGGMWERGKARWDPAQQRWIGLRIELGDDLPPGVDAMYQVDPHKISVAKELLVEDLRVTAAVLARELTRAERVVMERTSKDDCMNEVEAYKAEARVLRLLWAELAQHPQYVRTPLEHRLHRISRAAQQGDHAIYQIVMEERLCG